MRRGATIPAETADRVQVPRRAARVSEWAAYLIPIEHGTNPRTVLIERGHCSIWKIREGGNHEWDAVIEDADASLQQRAPIFGQRQEKSGAKSSMRGSCYRVVVEAHTEA